MTDFKIPVDSMVAQFGDHLKAYPRTILSAKFGDGKSYFLDAVKKDKTLGEKFVFLTIYPINYQVMGNEDIFDLIKYDILYQLILNGVIILHIPEHIEPVIR